MNVTKKIFQLIGKAGSWLGKVLTDNWLWTLIISFLSLLGLGGEGAHKYCKAKKINKEAEAIRNAAIEKRDNAYHSAEMSLERLGELKVHVAESFEAYDAVMAQIIDLPKTKIPKIAGVLLPNLDTREYKKISEGVRMVVDGAAGAAGGTLIGVAMTGLGAVALAPGMVLAGAALFVKGSSLEKKAYNKVRLAKEIDSEANKLVEYYGKFSGLTDDLASGIAQVHQVFLLHLEGVRILVDANPSWKSYSKAEQKTITNTAKLALALKNICEVVPATKPEKEDELNPLNEKGVKQALKDVNKQLSTIKDPIENRVVASATNGEE